MSSIVKNKQNSEAANQGNITVKSDTLFQELYLKVCRNKLIGNSLHSYVKNSHEYDAQSVSLIYILTNNVINYDCTVLPLLSIQLNIAKRIKYVYFMPDKSQFDTLVAKVVAGFQKTEEELKNVDRWARYHCSIAMITQKLLQDFFCKNADEIIGLLSLNERIDDCRKIARVKDLIKRVDFLSLSDWLRCVNRVDFDKIKNNCNALLEVSKLINGMSSAGSLYCCKLIELSGYVSDLVELSEYILNYVKDSEETGILRRLNVPEIIREWLRLDSLDEAEIRSLLEFKSAAGDKMCYNFCLILNNGGAVNGASWYLVSGREQIDDVNDNFVLLYKFESTDENLLKEAFESLL